jgi:hypothetical protein
LPDFAYDPAYESQVTEQFLKDVPEPVWRYVKFVLSLKLIGDLDDKGREVWGRLVSTFPVLQRVIVYTYSPLEAFDMRLDLLRLWAQADEDRGDFRDPQALNDATFAWSISKHPEISKYPEIVEFLKQLRRDIYCVWQADLRKAAGHPDSLEELRENWKTVDKQGSRTVIKIDQSPFYKIDHVIINEPEGRSRIEIHYHFLEGPTAEDLERFFTGADAYLVEQIQMFGGDEEVKNIADSRNTKVYVYDRGGNLIKPPGQHTNPYPFVLRDKYAGLLKSIEPMAKELSVTNKEIQDDPEMIDKLRILERQLRSEYVEWVFKDKVIKEWKGDRPPVAHFDHTLRLRVIDLLRKLNGKIPKLDGEPSLRIIYEIDLSQGDDSAYRLGEGDALEKFHPQSIALKQMIKLKELEQEKTDPVEKLIIKNLREIFSDPPLADRATNKEIARQAKSEFKKKVTPQRVGQIKQKVYPEVAELLVLKKSS